MISLTIIVTSAVLVLSSNPAQPELYCVVGNSSTSDTMLYHNPEGGCTALGRALLKDAQDANPSVPFLLVVDGESSNSI
ncbi:hypothetical protein HOU74_gp39 [Pectobacterium phage Phoria]|uniref:Uncharacterized protein n=1 Tax=Pectobacterium phage Phoria TaxID=2489634 RepID=A0A3G8FJH7_9CAUD|nr:hypothetical protein HOU74_gp39 [Pectobacterium phage Phoria]AZF94945.1 hypothetical protein [Pectobacterium phage Phoria]